MTFVCFNMEMLKINVVCTCVALVILSGCSKEEIEVPKPAYPVCSSRFENFEVDPYAHTGHMMRIRCELFCQNDVVSVLIDGKELPYTWNPPSLDVVVPETEKDSVSVKIKTKFAIINTGKKIAIFPGGGTWEEVAAIPELPQGFGSSISTQSQNTGFIFRGGVYTGPVPFSNYERSNKLFSYQPETNQWQVINSDDRLREMSQGVAAGDVLFFFNYYQCSNPLRYDRVSGQFSLTENPGYSNEYSYCGVTINDEAFMVNTGSIGVRTMRVKKYNPATNSWVFVAAKLFEQNISAPSVDFVLHNNGKAIIGWNIGGSAGQLQLWEFDPSTLSFTMITQNSALKFLFRIDDRLYFMYEGTYSIGEAGVDVPTPDPHLHIYDLENNIWTSSPHAYPPGFFGVVSLTINNHGFAGLGLLPSQPGDQLFRYSNTFYKFTPK
jgi:hypothetical protein